MLRIWLWPALNIVNPLQSLQEPEYKARINTRDSYMRPLENFSVIAIKNHRTQPEALLKHFRTLTKFLPQNDGSLDRGRRREP